MIQGFLSFLLLYKYTTLFLVTFLSAIIVPLPATTSLLAAGAFASQGYLNLFDVCAAGFLGSILGDSIGYFIAFQWGQKILLRVGYIKKVFESQKFQKIKGYFSEHYFAAIFYSRFLVMALGVPINLLSGFFKLSYKKFLFFDITGQLIYVLLYAGIGYVVGNEWQYIAGILENTAILIVLAVMVFLIRKFSFIRRR